jgi:CubicO group peptidase (beta-lactamase class C family)
MHMRFRQWAFVLLLMSPLALRAEAPVSRLTDYFPPAESKGGWRSLLPESGEPSPDQKAKVSALGIDWDKLKLAWDHNASTEDGATGLLVVRKGQVVGEWYKNCDRNTAFNIYSSSKAYTSLAYGILLADSTAGKAHKKITLDTKVMNEEWLPEALPLTDPRKADITVRHLLNMASGFGGEPVPQTAPFEWSLGKVDGSPMAKLKGEPGTVFNYSNAGVAHLVLVFQKAAGRDLFPFMKERVFDRIGMERVTWQEIGGQGKIGPFNQGFSGVHTTPREHARFCYLAMHKGKWADKTIVPSSYYDFAWKGIKPKPEYGAQWWVYPRHKNVPKDMVQTAGAFNNHGYVVPSLDLIFIRLGDGKKFPPKFQEMLIEKVLAAAK